MVCRCSPLSHVESSLTHITHVHVHTRRALPYTVCHSVQLIRVHMLIKPIWSIKYVHVVWYESLQGFGGACTIN